VTRMTITVDENLVEETRKAFKVKTKAEAIRRALEEAVRRRKLEQVLSHAGRVEIELDEEKLRLLRGEG
jgi:Arc/MetJ family transcription regulator